MPKTTITTDAWECFRCGYIWPDKRQVKPPRCAGCGSVYWDVPKKDKVKEEEDDE